VRGGVAEAALLSIDEDILFHPYIRRPVPFERNMFDLVSVYDFGGFWFSTDDPARRQALVTEFEHAFGQHASATGLVSEFLRCHPLADVASLQFQQYVLRKHQDNVIVCLTGGSDNVRAGYSDNRRRRVRQGYRNGLSLELVRDPATFMGVYYRSL